MPYSIIILGDDFVDIRKEDAIFDSLVLELRRGTIILSVLSQLKSPQYGYSLVVLLEEKGIAVDSGTLYPLLRRLEKQEILQSSWDVESAKPRKYYELSSYGKEIYEKLCKQWITMTESISKLINEDGGK
jgi:PadR family transcriptional regulator, regulatory protein PadR